MPSANLKRLRWPLGLAGVAVVLLVLAGVFAFQALQARSALVSVAGDFQQVADGLRSGDPGSARDALDSAREQSRRADDATDGLLWSAASHAPAVGDDLAAVRTVAEVSRTLSDDVLPGAVTASAVVDPSRLSPRNGRIPLAPLRKTAPEIVAADRELQAQAATVRAIDTSTLTRQVAGPVEDLQRKLSEAATLSSRASYAARLLPTMLGADGPRTYLVLFQNNAEIRATGGIPGAVAVMRAQRGKLSMVGQGTAQDFGVYQHSPIPLTKEEIALYDRKLGMFGQDVNFTPDFPRSAELAHAMWRSAQKQRTDGVLSADPVALSYLLDATGPVRVPRTGVTLTSDNAVRVLLSDVYRRIPDPERQNAFFAAAARAVFDAVASGKGDPTTLLKGLARAGSEGRLYAWSDVRREQALLSQTRIGGAVPRDAGRSPYLGVFMNDGTAAKMEYYLDHRVDVKPVSCTSSGRQALEVTVKMRSDAPADPAKLPPYVKGREGQAYFGVKPGHMRLNVHLYAPIGGWIKEAELDGGEAVMSENEHLGHPVGSQSVDLAPGQERRLTYTVMTGPDQTGPVDLRVTPGVRGTGIGTVGNPACTGS